MGSLPAVLDVREELREIRTAVEREGAAGADTEDAQRVERDDVREEIAAIAERLDEYAGREAGDRESLLDEIDNRLLRLETELAGDAARRTRAARNRIEQYRDALGRSADDLLVTHAGFGGDDRTVVPEDIRDESGSLSVTVVNDGAEPRTGVPVVTFYDGEGAELSREVGPEVTFAPDEQETVDLAVTVPHGARSYAVSVPAETPATS